MRQPRFLLLSAAIALPAAAHAEANVCQAVTANITTPGSYCLQADFIHQGGPGDIGIFINANDVTLDCNGFRVVGPSIAPDAVAPDDPVAGIYVGSSERVTVRNCRVTGFSTGIFAGRADTGLSRSREVVLENNTLIGNVRGIFLNVEGNNQVRNNLVSDVKVRGIEAYAAPGQVTISNNAVLRAGDTTYNEGRGGYFSSELGGWMIVEGNVFSEVVAPAGTAGSPAVRLGPGGGIGVMFANNRILAPANPSEKGADTVSIDNSGGNGCEGNLVVGYGTTPIPGCTVPTNEQR